MRTLLIFGVAAFAVVAGSIADDELSEALRAVAQGTIDFSNNFVKVVATGTPGNLISSPLSAQVVLAMAAYGAGGTTANQMRSVLHIPTGDNEFSLSGYKSLIETLNAVKGVELRLANKIYTANNFVVKPEYKQLTTEKFLSPSQELDFNNAEAAASTINSWCLAQTNNRIRDIITPDGLNADTRLVLVNAVYFKGQWAKKFDPELTQDEDFHIDARTTRRVPTMFITHRFRCGDLHEVDARFIELPYQEEEASMIIILPNQVDGLKRVQDNLHQINLTESLRQVSPRNVDLHLPKFRIESKLDLKDTLEKMGMTDMFQRGADFSGIADTPLKVSKVIQKAFIEVNEEGTEAAAATGFQIQLISANPPRPEFKIDRPFYFAIYHSASKVVLFPGVVHYPSSP